MGRKKMKVKDHEQRNIVDAAMRCDDVSATEMNAMMNTITDQPPQSPHTCE
jgi:hypothetical protein